MEQPRRLPSGTWQARYTGVDGKRRSAGNYSTKKDAQRAQRRALAEEEKGQRPKAPTVYTTVAEYSRTFLLAIETEVVHGTWKNHERSLRLHILPRFGTRRLSSVKPSDVKIWHQGLPSHAVARSAYGTLSLMMRMAVDDDLIPKTPCRVRGAMGHKESRGAVFAEEDAQAIIDALAEPFKVVALVQYGAALRPSEALGLDWGLVDLDTGALDIRQQAYKGGLVERTKTGRTRVAWLLSDALEALRVHRRRNSSIGSTPVFTGRMGRRVSYNSYCQAIIRARAEAGVQGFTAHQFRHVALAAYQRHTGNLVETMARGGHTDYRSALVYQKQAAGRPAALADFEAMRNRA